MARGQTEFIIYTHGGKVVWNSKAELILTSYPQLRDRRTGLGP